MNKKTERLLLDINQNLRIMRSSARRQAVMPYELCKEINELCTETLKYIKDFREMDNE